MAHFVPFSFFISRMIPLLSLALIFLFFVPLLPSVSLFCHILLTPPHNMAKPQNLLYQWNLTYTSPPFLCSLLYMFTCRPAAHILPYPILSTLVPPHMQTNILIFATSTFFAVTGKKYDKVKQMDVMKELQITNYVYMIKY